MDAPDRSGQWEPIYKPGRAEPIGWAHRRTGKVVQDGRFSIEGARIVFVDDDTIDAMIAQAERVEFLEKFTGLKVSIRF